MRGITRSSTREKLGIGPNCFGVVRARGNDGAVTIYTLSVLRISRAPFEVQKMADFSGKSIRPKTSLREGDEFRYVRLTIV